MNCVKTLVLLCVIALSGCVDTRSIFQRKPPSTHVPPISAHCVAVSYQSLNLDANRTLHINRDRCEAPHHFDLNQLLEYIEFTFYDGTLRVVGRVDPSNPKRMNIVEISEPTSRSKPQLIREIYGLFQLAMRQYLVKQRILEIYYINLGRYQKLPPPK